MKITSATMLITSFFLLVIIFQFTSIPVLADTTFQITVQNYHGSPLKGVKVQLINKTNNEVEAEGTSDSSGKVSLTALKNESYILKALYLNREVGYIDDWNYSSPSSPKTIRVGVFNLKIRVMSSEKLDPVPNAKVNITSTETDPDVDKRKVTDSNGYVVFENLPNGTTYHLTIKYEDKVAVTSSQDITLTDEYEYVVTLNLYRLTLRLRDSSLQPVKGATVKLWRGEVTGTPFATLISGTDGNATFKLLPQGTYIYTVEYKSEEIYKSDSFTLNRNRVIDVSLQLKTLIVNIKSKSGNTAAGFTYTGRLIYDGRTYAEATTNDGILNFGIVYENRDYVLKVFFEGSEIYSGVIKESDIGAISIIASIGDFSIKVSTADLFGKLKDMKEDISLRIKFGKYQVEKKISEGAAIYRDHPLVKYEYELVINSDVVGAGSIDAPQHQSIITIAPDAKQVKITALSLDNRTLSGKLILMLQDGEKIGEVDIKEDSTIVKGLLRIKYSYQFFYMGELVAEGNIEKRSIDESKLDIIASVSNVKIIALDYSGDNKLVGASILLSIGQYKSTKITNDNGEAEFENVPLSRVFTTIYYKGIKVYSGPNDLSPTRTTLTISGTGVYQIIIKVVDGEKEPLANAELEGIAGDYQLVGKLNEKGIIEAMLVPNGTMNIKVKYLGLNVYEDAHKIDRNGQTIEIVSKVYPMLVNSYKVTERGDEPLERALIHFEKDGLEVFVGDIKDGVFQYKLPSSNYNVWIEYQGVKVAEKLVQHNGPTKLSMPTDVYEFSLYIIDLAENPMSGINVEFRRDNKLITSGETDMDGKILVSLAKGDYIVEYSVDDARHSYVISVEDVEPKVLVTSRSSPFGLMLSLMASASLGAVSIFSVIRSFKVKPTRRSPVLGGRSVDWKKRHPKPVKKNV